MAIHKIVEVSLKTATSFFSDDAIFVFADPVDQIPTRKDPSVTQAKTKLIVVIINKTIEHIFCDKVFKNILETHPNNDKIVKSFLVESFIHHTGKLPHNRILNMIKLAEALEMIDIKDDNLIWFEYQGSIINLKSIDKRVL